ncbi:MAG: TRAP transporter small permease subunit [Desulfotalea sp.]
MLLRLEKFFVRANKVMGKVASILLLLMVINVFYDVVMRYFFRNSSVGMQELEWHLFSMVFLIGISVALLDEAHVRVDFLYERYSLKTKAVVNIIGTVFFLVPLALLISSGSFDYVVDSYASGEISGDPGGLTHRYLIKAMIPFSFVLLLFAAVGYVVKNINLYRFIDSVAPEVEKNDSVDGGQR